MSSGEITGVHFQSLGYLVQKCGTFFNLVAQFSVLKFIINKCHNYCPTAAISVFELFHVMNVEVDS